MLVFWKQNLVFLSVPKTGTTAWQQALAPLASMVILDPPELKHAPLYRYNRFFRPMFDKTGGEGIETLAVVREPTSWLGSWYRYRRRPFMKERANHTFDVSFDDFVQAHIAEKPPGFANVGSQFRFLEPRRNGLAVTHLFRYEQQPALIAFLQERLGTMPDLPRVNVSPEIDLALSPATKAALRQARTEDFALWEGAAR